MFNCKKLKKYSLILSLFIVLIPIYIIRAQTESDWAKGIARSLINCPFEDTIYVDMEIDPQRARSYCCAKVKDKRTGEEKEIVISSDHPEHPKNFPCEYRGSYVCIVKYDKPQKPKTDYQKQIQQLQQLPGLPQEQTDSEDLQSHPTSFNFLNKILSVFNVFSKNKSIEKTSLLAAAGESSGCTARDDIASGSNTNPQNSTTPGTPSAKPPQKPTNPAYGDMSSGSGSYDYDKLKNTNGNAGAADTGSGNNTTNTNPAGTGATGAGAGATGLPKAKGHTGPSFNPNGTPQVPESMIKRGKAPEVDPRYAFVYGNNNTQATPQNVHPKGYESGDKYIVPIAFQNNGPMQASFKGRPTPFDDLFMTDDDLQRKEEERKKEESQSFADLFYKALVGVMSGKPEAKAQFKILTTGNNSSIYKNKSQFKTNTRLDFNNSYQNNQHNENESDSPNRSINGEIDYKEDILDIEKEASKYIAKDALVKATAHAAIVKDRTACKEYQDASRCIVYRIEKAQEAQREAFVEELSKSPLSSSTKQYYIDIYDGKVQEDPDSLPLISEIEHYKQWSLEKEPILSKELKGEKKEEKDNKQEKKSLAQRTTETLRNIFDTVLSFVGL